VAFWYRTSGFRGHPIQIEEPVEQGVGTLTITPKNVYFVSPQKAFRRPLKEILSVRAYSNGIQILSDGANKRPEIFVIDDVTFAINLLNRLSPNGG
jgi:hypothetical protein